MLVCRVHRGHLICLKNGRSKSRYERHHFPMPLMSSAAFLFPQHLLPHYAPFFPPLFVISKHLTLMRTPALLRG